MVAVPAPVPVPGVCHSQVASWLMPQRSTLLPALLMVKVWAGGLLPPCCAVKDRLGGVMPMVESTESDGSVGGETSCAKPDISADIPRIDRPPEPPLPEEAGFPTPAAAKGMMPAGIVPVAVNPMGARGTAAPILLRGTDGSTD